MGAVEEEKYKIMLRNKQNFTNEICTVILFPH